MTRILQSRGLGYLAAILGIAAVTTTCVFLRSHINEMTVALSLLLAVLFIAAAWGRWPGLVASMLGMLCLNYFFLPPIYTFTIADPKNWTALGAFFITALTAGQLSTWVRQRAAEAEASRSQARLASTYNRSLLEASIDPLVTIGHDGRINDVNAAAETVTGCSRADLIGTEFAKYFTEPGKARAACEQVFGGGVVRSYALELRHRNGHSTSVLYDGSIYRDADGNAIGVVAATRPISTYTGKTADARPDPRIVRHLDLFAGFASLLSVAVGLLSIVGLIFQIAVLKSIIPGQPVIKFNAALCLVLLGLSLWLLRQHGGWTSSRIAKVCGQWMAAIAAIVGLLSVTEHITGWDLGIDQLMFREPVADAFFSVRPGLIAPITALDFLFLGLALLLLDQGMSWRPRRHWPAEYFASLTAILSILGLLDFVLASQISYTHIALQTAITLLVLSFGVLCARTERGLTTLLTSSAAGGVLTRRLLPAAVIIPIVIGALGWKAFSGGLYSAWSVLSLMIIGTTTLLSGFAIWNGYIVNRGDAERRRAEGVLRRREVELREAERLARMGSWWWDPKTDSVTLSGGLSHVVRRDPMSPPSAYKEHLGFYSPQSSAKLDAAIQDAIQTGAPFELDLEMVRTDGAIRLVAGRGEVERDADGQIVLVRGTVQDVTELKQAEAEVRSSEARHAAMVQASLDAIIVIDAHGAITEFNPAAEQMFGHHREDVLGHEIANVIIPPSLRDRHREGLARYLATGQAEVLGRRVEMTAIRASGEEFPVELAIARIASSGPAQFTAYIGDITERKRAEYAVRQSEANLNRAQGIAHIGSWHLDLAHNRLTWSDEVFRIFGVPKGPGLTYEAFLDAIHPEDREAVNKAWTAALHGARYDIEHRIVVGGEVKWVRERARVEFGKDGNAIEGLGTVQDITERKRTEEALQRSANEIRDLYEHAPCGYHSVDKDGVFVRINDTELSWLGYTRAEIIDKMKFSDLLTPESLRISQENFPKFKAEGATRDLEYDMIRKDGTILPVLLSATAITDNEGNYLVSRSTIYDITARKQAENEIRTLAHLQSVVAELGERALRGATLSQMLDDTANQTAHALGVEYCSILELLPNRDALTLRAGAGWKPGYVGHATVGLGTDSQAGYTLLSGEPVLVEDLQVEKRFAGNALLHDHDVVSGASVVVSTSEGPYGVLAVHTRHRRSFSADEVNFLQAVANVLGSVIERHQSEVQLWRVNQAQRVLSKCNEALIRATEENTLLQQICDLIVEEAGYRLCWVGRAENDKVKSVPVIAQAGFEAGYLTTLNVTWADTERGRGPTGTCIRNRETVVTKHIDTDPNMSPWRAEALKRGYGSSVSIPLIVDAEVFGAIMIYAAEPDAFGAEEVKLLTELASDLAFGIGTLRTRRERVRAVGEIRTLNAELEQRVLSRTAELQMANTELAQAREREVEIGFRIQQTLLLDRAPEDVPGLRVAALSVPSQRIDGDFYIFIEHRHQALDVIVGDVMGKGVPGALLGAATKTHFLKALSDLMAISREGVLPEPKEVVMLAHAGIVRHLIELESFVTLCYARLDVKRGILDIVDCGHTGTIHLHGKTGLSEVLHGDNLPMGVREGEIYDQFSFPIEPGDSLLFFSDGITEARNPSKELFGLDRLEECLRTNRSLVPSDVVEAIRKSVISFSETDRLADDLTSVAVQVVEAQIPLVRSEIDIQSDLKELRLAREFVRGFCNHLPGPPLDEDSVGSLELAVNEAASNIMKHAYRGRVDQSIHIEAEAFPDRLLIRLHHFGDPFDPSMARPPAFDGSRESGFGAFIITRSVDEIRYYRDERGRNCVAMMKRRGSRKESES